jgi:hypothetical protein
MEFWEWCDDNLDDVDFDGDDAIVSLGDRDSARDIIDEHTGISGMAEALQAKGVDWIDLGDGSNVRFKKFRRHNGKTAKERASDNRKKANQRSCVPPLPGQEPGQEPGPEREESERRGLSLNSDRKANGSARAIGPRADHSLSLSRRVFVREASKLIANLDGLDWQHVCALAEAAGKRVPPRTADDRRQFLRFAVLAETALSEDWLMGAADSVKTSKGTKSSKLAHFVGTLKAKATDSGYDGETFLAMLASIEIPDDVWKSSVLELGK